jgi:hypothetical protein
MKKKVEKIPAEKYYSVYRVSSDGSTMVQGNYQVSGFDGDPDFRSKAKELFDVYNGIYFRNKTYTETITELTTPPKIFNF